MYIVHITHNTIELEQLTRTQFDTVMKRVSEAVTPLDRFTVPPADHVCTQCPVDPHTMRRVIRLVSDLRNGHLEQFNDKSEREPVHAMTDLIAVNTLDIALAYLCGALAPEIAIQLREAYSD